MSVSTIVGQWMNAWLNNFLSNSAMKANVSDGWLALSKMVFINFHSDSLSKK